MLKTLLKLITGIFVLVVAIGAGLLFFIDTNQYKSALESAVASNTGFELTIAGNLELDIFPTMGLTLNDVRIKNPASTTELASTSAITLKVDRSALISGNIRIQEFSANDFHINYIIDEAGNSDWIIDSDQVPAEPEVASESATDVSASFDIINIANASIDYQDLSQGAQYSLNNVNIESTNANTTGRPFGLNLDYDFVTYSDDNGLVDPIPMSLRSIISANLDTGSIEVSEFNFTVTPLLIQGNLQVTDINDSPNVSGTMRSDRIDLQGLMQTFASADSSPQAAAGSLPQLSFNLDFALDETQLVVSNLASQLGDSEISATATVRLPTEFAPANISYNIESGALDLSAFLASDTEASSSPTAASESTEATAPADTPLPIDLLSSFDLLGSIAIESLTLNEFLFEDINVFTNVESQILDIEIQPLRAFGGQINGNVRVDGRSSEAPLTSQLNLSQLNIIDLAPSISRFETVTGKLNVASDYSSSAASVNSLMDNLSGSTQFAVTENSVDISVIKQIFTTISALSPSGGSIGQWPDVIQFRELAGFIVLDQGIKENQQLNLKMDNFTLNGTGGVDLDQGTFDYQMAFTLLGQPEVQTIPVDELYHGVDWPVICAAPFEASASQYCSPDFTRVREIFAQIGTNALKGELQERIGEQIPENLRDAASGLLNNILN